MTSAAAYEGASELEAANPLLLKFEGGDACEPCEQAGWLRCSNLLSFARQDTLLHNRL